MKQKIFLALMMPFLFLTGISAQEATQTASEGANDESSEYWVGSASNNKKVLNPNKFGDNWFISVGAGTLFSVGDNGGSADFGKKIQPAVAVSVGKWLAPWGGLRLWTMYGRGSGHTAIVNSVDDDYHWNIINGYVDAMFNLNNIFQGYKESRKFQLMAILGLGVEHNWGYDDLNAAYGVDVKKKTLAGCRTGLMGSLRLNEKFALNLEASYNFVDDSYDGQTVYNGVDGHMNLLLNLVYRFKNHDDSRQFTFARRNTAKYDVINDEVNRLRRQADGIDKTPAVVINRKQLEGNHITTLISFDKNKSKINRLQEVNVYTAAEAIKKLNGADLYIAPMDGAADNEELFVKRAETIRDVLVKEYNVSADRIIISNDTQLVKSFAPEKDYVVVYIVK